MGQFLGHLGGGLMILFVLLLALRCARQLGILFWAPAPVRSSVPCWKPSPQAMAAAAAGVLVLQFLFAFVCWLDLGQSGGLSAFWQRFMERFTTAGDAVHYLTLARQGYLAEGETAKCIVFYPLYPLAVRLFHTLLSPFSVSWEGAALAVSWICWGGAGAAMLVLAGQDLKREQAIAAAALMALYPFSFFCSGGLHRESFSFAVSVVHDRCPAAGLAVGRCLGRLGCALPQPGSCTLSSAALSVASGASGEKAGACFPVHPVSVSGLGQLSGPQPPSFWRSVCFLCVPCGTALVPEH